ncbi:lyase family protein [Streptomyces sp. NPDC002851]
MSGRITQGPVQLLDEEVLEPQFRHESAHLLRWYVAMEKVFALEYERMGVITAQQADALLGVLSRLRPEDIEARADENMSDIAFAIERYVDGQLPAPVPAWHVDRSRNDFQACAQLMFGRWQTLSAADSLLGLARAALGLAHRTAHLPMPGHTHLQPAQIITPGFYFAGLVEQLAHSLRRLLTTYDGVDLCPLGGAAMAGQEIGWDRDRMAALLGFRAPRPHALVAVASRDWALELAAELSLLGSALSRFVTDLMNWGGGAYGFLELPDELSGISSAMPQKKNYPVLERIRGRTAHLVSGHLDMVLGQRNTPYSNSVEVSKEAGAHLLTLFDATRSLTRLFTAVLERAEFREERMRTACEREYLGGFTLANRLTLHEAVPWRTAQVVAGRYITAALDRGAAPHATDPELLRRVAAEQGVDLRRPEQALDRVFDVTAGLYAKRSSGSAHPDAVRTLLRTHERRLDALADEWRLRRGRTESALADLGRGVTGTRRRARVNEESVRA